MLCKSLIKQNVENRKHWDITTWAQEHCVLFLFMFTQYNNVDLRDLRLLIVNGYLNHKRAPLKMLFFCHAAAKKKYFLCVFDIIRPEDFDTIFAYPTVLCCN